MYNAIRRVQSYLTMRAMKTPLNSTPQLSKALPYVIFWPSFLHPQLRL